MRPSGHSVPNAQSPPEVTQLVDDEEPPPFLGTWPRLYAAIAGYLAVLITLFYLFTRAYRFPE